MWWYGLAYLCIIVVIVGITWWLDAKEVERKKSKHNNIPPGERAYPIIDPLGMIWLQPPEKKKDDSESG